MLKCLCKVIVKRSKLKNNFNKERNIENWFEYKHYCSNLLNQSKKHHLDQGIQEWTK